jgi:hypothetical protein
MKKFAVLVIICTVLAGCDEKKPSQPLTLEQVAQKDIADVGKFDMVYMVKKTVQNPDGSYVVINIQSAKKYDSYTSPKGNEYRNIVILENVPPLDITITYIDKSGLFTLYDEYGNKFIGEMMRYAWAGDKFTEIGVALPENINKYKFIGISGLDTTKGGMAKIILPLD